MPFPDNQHNLSYLEKYHKYREKYLRQHAGVYRGYDAETGETLVAHFQHRTRAKPKRKTK